MLFAEQARASGTVLGAQKEQCKLLVVERRALVLPTRATHSTRDGWKGRTAPSLREPGGLANTVARHACCRPRCLDDTAWAGRRGHARVRLAGRLRRHGGEVRLAHREQKLRARLAGESSEIGGHWRLSGC